MARFALLALAGTGGVALLSFGTLDGEIPHVAAAVGFYLTGCLIAAVAMTRIYPHPALGLCNIATLTRLVLTAALLVPLLAGGDTAWAVFVLALAALGLDGIDGWLARRQRLCSRFGAAFDMEVDSALGLLLAMNAFAAGTAGPLVLLLGLPRYLFLAASRLLPWLSHPLPVRFGRKVVCVMQIATLLLLQIPVMPAALTASAIAVTTSGLAWSFGRDILWLWRSRA